MSQYDSNGNTINEGDYVSIDGGTNAWMQGFTYGYVTKVGRKWVTVSWSRNDKVTRRFAGHLLTLR